MENCEGRHAHGAGLRNVMFHKSNAGSQSPPKPKACRYWRCTSKINLREANKIKQMVLGDARAARLSLYDMHTKFQWHLWNKPTQKEYGQVCAEDVTNTQQDKGHACRIDSGSWEWEGCRPQDLPARSLSCNDFWSHQSHCRLFSSRSPSSLENIGRCLDSIHVVQALLRFFQLSLA